MGEARRTYHENKSKCSKLGLSVKLELIGEDSPFYNLKGASSALTLYTDVLAPMTIISTEPTNSDTAFGCFNDILNIVHREE